MPTALEIHQEYASDIAGIWANWTSGRLTEEDAMVAIRDRNIELADELTTAT